MPTDAVLFAGAAAAAEKGKAGAALKDQFKRLSGATVGGAPAASGDMGGVPGQRMSDV